MMCFLFLFTMLHNYVHVSIVVRSFVFLSNIMTIYISHRTCIIRSMRLYLAAVFN